MLSDGFGNAMLQNFFQGFGAAPNLGVTAERIATDIKDMLIATRLPQSDPIVAETYAAVRAIKEQYTGGQLSLVAAEQQLQALKEATAVRIAALTTAPPAAPSKKTLYIVLALAAVGGGLWWAKKNGKF